MNEQALKSDWWSPTWFSPTVFKQYEWANAFLLYLLCLIPLFFLIRWLIGIRKRQKLEIALPQGRLHSDSWAWLRHLPRVLLALILALMIVALARPQTTNEQVDQWTEGIDIMLAIDISQSMMMEDFIPNRLEAAKQTAKDFINGRMNDRVGVVVFAGDAFSLCPLTTDKELLNTYIDDIKFDLIENRGTAIGSALAVATNRMRESLSATKVVILLSDGENTAGNIDPKTAAELAHAYNIKIYTIGVGKDGDIPMGKDFFGRPRTVPNNMNESTLREIAKVGEGQYYRASDNEALKMVFNRIDQYEKAEIKETRFKNTFDYYTVYLKWALALLAVWMMLKLSPIANVLED